MRNTAGQTGFAKNMLPFVFRHFFLNFHLDEKTFEMLEMRNDNGKIK